MRVNFLCADIPLSKSFKEIAPGVYHETSYPNVSNFISTERGADDIEGFYNLTVAAAAEGFCLIKGHLDRPLDDESRAGHTNATEKTDWICLDIDYSVTDQTPEQFVDTLDPELKGVSFFLQYSASMHIKHHTGWRGHIFILLSEPQSPQALKQWLIKLNLRKPMLASKLRLSASGGALVYPLDVTTCQNDKLLYIAPPLCTGFEDPVPERFKLFKRSRPRAGASLAMDVSAASNSSEHSKKIASLRSDSGLPARTFKITQHQGWEVLTNPDPVTVTGKKEERGFVYLNLNNGDSWGYYFPVNNPDILFNFKGEPCMYMWDVDKDIYNEYSSKPESIEGAIPFGFLWADDDTYYRGFANPETQELVWLQPTGSKSKLRDFFAQHRVQLPTGWAVDEWTLEFDPTTDGCADFVRQRVNTYRKTEYIKGAKRREKGGLPPTIDKVLTSVCVDQEVKDYFLNWLAAIFQTRVKTNTAWIFQGVQGTGKGVLFTHIVAPLVGRTYCHEMTMDRLDDDYNAYLKNNIILFIDEANISDSRNGDRLLNRIKNLITEPEQHIRAMRSNAVIMPNFSNIILASNYDEIIPLEKTDRRFNVAPRQEKPIVLEYNDIVQIRTELTDFADYLHSYKVDYAKTRQVLMSEAREKLIKLSETTIDSFFIAIKSGDLSYFTQYLDNTIKSDAEGIRYHDYSLVVKRWANEVGVETNVSRGELRTCYQFLQNTNISTTKFSRMCNKYSLDVVPVRVGGEVTRGLYGVRWQLEKKELDALKEEANSNVINLRSK